MANDSLMSLQHKGKVDVLIRATLEVIGEVIPGVDRNQVQELCERLYLRGVRQLLEGELMRLEEPRG